MTILNLNALSWLCKPYSKSIILTYNKMNLIQKISQFIPVPHLDSHKGEMGKILVVGGSKEYTGAPYFSAISSLKLGADLAHIICPPEAATVIKCYSPELMVHPILEHKHKKDDVLNLIYKMHVVIIGPGLGNSEEIIPCVLHIIEWAKDLNKFLVIDADGLQIIKNHPDIIVGYRKTILTPNANEFKQLYSKLIKHTDSFDATEEQVSVLATKLDGVTICKKGPKDIISDGSNSLVCDVTGSPRRCGGQGDILSGMIGVLLHWLTWKNPEQNNFNDKICEKDYQIDYNLSNMMLAAFGACHLVRECNKRAYAKKGMSTLTEDMIAEINGALTTIFTL